MEEAEASRYWCHMCSQTVNPIMEIETIKCPICQSGFVEEMASATAPGNDSPLDLGNGGSALSAWAPILLGMMGNPRHHRQLRRMEFEDNNEDDNHGPETRHVEDQELESIMRRRRSSTAILQLLQGIRAGMLSQSGNLETVNWDRDGRRVILINPFNNQTIVPVEGSHNNSNTHEFHNRAPIGDYVIGPAGLDLLLQHLAENDPNRYGTPPARKEAVDALPTVKIEEATQCCVCLDECEVGAEVKEMPCKHKFHSRCIVPWLELHSSCPVCRYQLPADDESKLDHPQVSRNNSSNQESVPVAGNGDQDNSSENGRRFSIPLVWPFTSLFSSSASQTSAGGNSSLASSPSTSRADEN